MPSEPFPSSGSAALATYHTQLTRELALYYDRSKVLLVLRQFVRELTQRFHADRLVPLNPFPPLLALLRRAEIDANELLNREPRKPPPQELLIYDPRDRGGSLPLERQTATIRTTPPPLLVLWGERRVLERVPYSERWQRRMEAMVGVLGPSWLNESEIQDEGCRVRSVGAVVGSAVLLCQDEPSDRIARAEIERHVVVTGDHLEFGMTVFARQLIRTLFEISKKPAGSTSDERLVLKGATAIEISLTSEKAVWTTERLAGNRQAFFTAAKMALAAGGSFSMDTLYEVTGESSRLLRLSVEFIFHLDSNRSKAATTTSMKTASHSFVGHSRLEESGVCLSSGTALELTRRQLNHAAATPATGLTTRQRPLDNLVQRVSAATPSGETTRYWLGLLPSTAAFRLVSLVSTVEDLLFTLRMLPNTEISRLLRPVLNSYTQEITQLIHDAAIGRSASLLLGLSDVLRDLCSLPRETSALETDASLDALDDRLHTARDALTWLSGAATRDFLHLIDPSTLPSTAMADLRADIALAIQQRRFPPAIVVEAVFSQYLTETKLDVTLKRALVNAVASGLPPNPFIPIAGFTRSSAAAFLQLQCSIPVTDSPELTTIARLGFALDTADATGRSICLISANRRLLAVVNGPRVAQILSFLTSSRVLRSDAYQPPKASYSARVSASLLVDDPLLFVHFSGVLMETVEVVEHIVIEGQDESLALSFFAEAVRRDVARLLGAFHECTLELLGPDGAVLTPVELHETQMFEQLIVEATPKQCVLRASLPPAIGNGSEPLLRVVRKLYMLHHISTEPTDEAARVGDFLRCRLRQFAVFTDLEAARITLTATGEETSDMQKQRTVRRAHERGDALLLGHMERLTIDNRDLRPTPDILWRLYDMETALEWLMRQAATQAHAQEVLAQISSAIELHVTPIVDAVGLVDAQQFRETIEGARAPVLSDVSASEAAARERSARRMLTLVVLVRFALQANLHVGS